MLGHLAWTIEQIHEVTKIEIEVGKCIDLLTVLDKIGYGRSHCAKKRRSCSNTKMESIMEKLLLVCTFQYSERPVMSMENIE